MAKKAKESVLLKKFQNGPDIIKAMEWLKNNHDQFAGHVYDPLMISIDVQNAAQNAKYLEYLIPTRDLQAFAAENAEDRHLLNISLDKARLKSIERTKANIQSRLDRLNQEFNGKASETIPTLSLLGPWLVKK